MFHLKRSKKDTDFNGLMMLNGRDSFNLPFPVSKENDCKAERSVKSAVDITNRQINTKTFISHRYL